MSDLSEHAVVPLVDISGWQSSDPSARTVVAGAVDHALRDVGFLQITGHGVDRSVVDPALAAMDAYFAMPLAAKEATRPTGPGVNRGYAPSQSEALSYSLGVDSPPDLLQAFIMGPERLDLDDPAVVAELDGVFHPNLWPEHLPGFREALTAYFEAAGAVARELIAIFASALGMPREFFLDKIDHSTETMRLNFYQRRASDPAPLADQRWLGAHTDYGIVTVLYGDAVPGLELLGSDGEWHSVLPAADSFLVNIGDLLAEWTNDRWRSTVHRVVPPGAAGDTVTRRSLAFFLDGNHDALIECLPTCWSTDNPPRYPPVLAGEHLRAKVLSGRTLSTDPRDGLVDTLGDRRT